VRTHQTLITVPYVVRSGGVSHYYEAIRPYLGSEVKILRIGAPNERQRGLSRIVRALFDNVRLAGALVRSDTDVVHVNPSLDPRSLLRDGLSVLVARAFRRQVIVFFRGWDLHTESRISKSYLGLFRAVFFRADACIVLYSGFRTRLKEWGYPGPVHVLTTVVSDDGIAATSPEAIRARCGREGRLQLLFMARLRKRKGVYETIDAYASARDEVGNLDLVVAGFGPEEEGARQAAVVAGIPQSAFVGELTGSRKIETLLSSDIFILPTTYREGMPNAVLEALALGLTVIACPVAGLQDFFADGKLGLVAPDPSPASLSALIVMACKDAGLRQEYGLRGHDFAKRHFTAALSAQRLTRIYEAVRGSRVRRGTDTAEYVWYEAEI
jgi:glycosyltransferase involved in cell wall biosynthesis